MNTIARLRNINSGFPILRGLVIFQALLVLLGAVGVIGIFAYSSKLEADAALRATQDEILAELNNVGEKWVAWQELTLKDALKTEMDAFKSKYKLKSARLIKNQTNDFNADELIFKINVPGDDIWQLDVRLADDSIAVKKFSMSAEMWALIFFVILFLFILVSSQKYIVTHIHTPLMALRKLLRQKTEVTSVDLSEIKAEGEISAFAIDIAEIVKSNTCLQAKAAKAEIAKQVAHDIRSPLTALLSISKTNLNTPEQRQLLEGVIKRITSIADDLLTKSKSDTAEKKEEVSLNDLIKEIVAEKRAEHANANGVIISEIIDENRRAVLDSSKIDIKRIMSNLINNSVESTVNQNDIQIATMISHNQTQILICDRGAGIPEHILTKLNAEKPEAVTTKDHGNGMGVASAKSAIQSYGGSMIIKSRPGAGTLVDIRLPTKLRPA